MELFLQFSQTVFKSWAGYMSTKFTNQILAKSYVTMLPILNLRATDMTALHSLLCFVVESWANINLPTPTVTFNQLFYVKAYEIVSTKKKKISLIGGFHQLMSFIGSEQLWNVYMRH